MDEKHNLQIYRQKRDFGKTREPSGGTRKPGPRPIFVIQKHAASTLHYDFRLEVDGVLKSWAVPKGPSTDPQEKRLAVPTEDHPLEYADFEGVIPSGVYGGGTIMIWDEGTYENLREDQSFAESLKKGHASFFLKGKKLKGGYALTRFRRGGDENWLLVKIKDDQADAKRNPVRDEPASARSGRTLEEIAAEEVG